MSPDYPVNVRRRILHGLCFAAVVCSAAWCEAQTPETGKPTAKPDAVAAETRKLSEQILQKTAGARDKLVGQEIGSETQKLQQDVVADLETLIELLKKSPPPPPSTNSSSNSNSSQDQSQQQQNSSSESESKSRKSKSQGSGSGRNRDRPQDSEERNGESRESKQRADRKQRLENDIWGHLPPALREELLNTYGERMLPQYEEFVRKFYEALSEPARAKKR